MRNMSAKAAWMRARYVEQRQAFIVLLGGRCVKCGSTDDLQFDHRDPKLKSFGVSRYVSQARLPSVLAEVMKCQLLCATHHRRKTAAEQSQPRGFTHGTVYGWMTQKCLCEQCQAAKWKWHNKRNAARRLVRTKPNKTTRMAQ